MRLVLKYFRCIPYCFFIEPFSELYWDSLFKVFLQLSKKVQIFADDITVTNPEIIKKGIEKAANCLLLKVNRMYTLQYDQNNRSQQYVVG